jgi:hypothetical protein
MTIPRPKILTAVTVPTGGWALDMDISVAGQYDTAVDVVVPAGTYFVSGDNQSDDLLFAIQTVIQTALTAVGADRFICIWIDPDTHKVKICFAGSNFTGATKQDVRIDWPGSDSGLYQALGFDGSAIDASTAEDEPIFTADYQHAWGWYADEDGQLESLDIEDRNIAQVLQSTSISGRVKSQLVGDRYAATLRLQFLERAHQGRTKVYSRGVAYGAASVYPYERNQPLECWWMEARKGTRFRVYADARIDTAKAALMETELSATVAPEYEFNDVALDTDPQRCAGGVVWVPSVLVGYATRTDTYQAFYVASNTAGAVTFANEIAASVWDGTQEGYFFDHRYQTYVLDVDEMSTFAPDEIPALDRFNIAIPLKRYVA